MAKLLTNFRWGFTGETQWMLIENGRVISREGGEPPAELAPVDLQGVYLLPAFIDAHCHILPTGLDLQKLHLGECTSPEDILDKVQERDRQLPEGEWLMAVHYDQTKFPDGEHMHRRQLDAISTSRPILLRHVNGHASIANTACLQAAKVDDATPDPKGGTYVKDSSGHLTGVLLEHAHELVTNAAGVPSLEKMVEAILQAGEKMAALGIACASDMMTGRYNLEQELNAYRIAAERGCKVRTRLYLQWATVFGRRALDQARIEELASQMDRTTCRIAGIKIFADGAIGSATAAIYGRFTGSSPSDAVPERDGQLMYAPERLKEMVRVAHEAGYRISIHSIGDYSTDLVMDSYSEVGDAAHHRIEHAMLLSDAQIDRMKKLGIHCAMQPEFLHWFGHSYKRQLGPEMAARLKRCRSVMDAGVPVSFNSDRPIVGGNPWDGIRTAENRPEGFDPSENVTRTEAVYAYTAMGAVANAEEAEMGRLEPGQLADYQLYAEDPMRSDDAAPMAHASHGNRG
jgi:predicted amidohydrolase YtcJ